MEADFLEGEFYIPAGIKTVGGGNNVEQRLSTPCALHFRVKTATAFKEILIVTAVKCTLSVIGLQCTLRGFYVLKSSNEFRTQAQSQELFFATNIAVGGGIPSDPAVHIDQSHENKPGLLVGIVTLISSIFNFKGIGEAIFVKVLPWRSKKSKKRKSSSSNCSTGNKNDDGYLEDMSYKNDNGGDDDDDQEQTILLVNSALHVRPYLHVGQTIACCGEKTQWLPTEAAAAAAAVIAAAQQHHNSVYISRVNDSSNFLKAPATATRSLRSPAGRLITACSDSPFAPPFATQAAASSFCLLGRSWRRSGS
jgi:hypothetical protein